MAIFEIDNSNNCTFGICFNYQTFSIDNSLLFLLAVIFLVSVFSGAFAAPVTSPFRVSPAQRTPCPLGRAHSHLPCHCGQDGVSINI